MIITTKIASLIFGGFLTVSGTSATIIIPKYLDKPKNENSDDQTPKSKEA